MPRWPYGASEFVAGAWLVLRSRQAIAWTKRISFKNIELSKRSITTIANKQGLGLTGR